MQNESKTQDFQATAALYALGSLSQVEAQAFEMELQTAEAAAQAEAAAFAQVVSQLSAAAPEVTPSSEVRKKLLTTIETDANQTVAIIQPQNANGFNIFKNDGDWLSILEGVSIKKLYRDPVTQFTTTLYKLEAGARLPNHRHHGNEQCFMIAGDFIINGKRYLEGDFTVALNRTDHLDLHSVGGATFLLISPPEIEVLA